MIDRLQLLGQATLFQLSQLPWQATGPVGLRPQRRVTAHLAEIRFPDTPAAREAEQICAEITPAALVNHSYRTYLFAAILGGERRVSFDEEALYIASLLHDLGIAEAHRRRGDGCFTLVGAAASEKVTADHNWDANRTALAAEAITLHMNLRMPKDALEARLLAAGAQLDVLGAGYWHWDQSTMESILSAYPRLEAKRELNLAFRTHAKQNPGTRASFYRRYLLMAMMIRLSPFAE